MRGTLGGSRLYEQPEHALALTRWRAFLATSRPVLLEIGFDHGRRLTHTAAHHPGWRVAGIEVRKQRVDEARAWGEAHQLHNLHVWRADARVVLAACTPDRSLDVIEALFPDPWVVASHRKRELVDDELIHHCARTLRPGGVLHLATDVPELAERFDAALATEPALRLDPAAAGRRPVCAALSRREWKCGREGTVIHRRWLRRL